MTEWLGERLKTTKNLCEIAEILLVHGHILLLPTVLELLHYYTQTLIDEECIEKT